MGSQTTGSRETWNEAGDEIGSDEDFVRDTERESSKNN